MSDDLAARIAEDEAAAAAATRNLRHIPRYDPARALREVAAKRAILALHAAAPRPSPRSPDCRQCHGQAWPCPTVQALAAIYLLGSIASTP